jgi:soluble lytic murein transglycosylase-like protein
MLAASAFAASPGAAQQGHMTTVVRADARTGRLVRSIAMEPAVVAVEDRDLIALIDRIAGEQGVESHLVHSVIRAESNYNAAAVSPKGALGIMQLIPATARRFGVSNIFDAQDNIRGGVRYLRFLLDYYQNDYPKAIAAYNAGESAVDKYNGVPPFAETQNYVYQVAKNLKTAREHAGDSEAFINKNQETAGNEIETPRPIQTSTGSDGRVYYRTP